MQRNPLQHDSSSDMRQGLSKVLEVTIFFWVIKILATTVGETGADFVDSTLGFGVTTTVVVVILAVGLAAQFASSTPCR